MQKHVNLVDLVKSFPTNIFLQNLASIQKRTSPIKFAHLAEKSEKGSISNLSTKVARLEHRRDGAGEDGRQHAEQVPPGSREVRRPELRAAPGPQLRVRYYARGNDRSSASNDKVDPRRPQLIQL